MTNKSSKISYKCISGEAPEYCCDLLLVIKTVPTLKVIQLDTVTGTIYLDSRLLVTVYLVQQPHLVQQATGFDRTCYECSIIHKAFTFLRVITSKACFVICDFFISLIMPLCIFILVLLFLKVSVSMAPAAIKYNYTLQKVNR